MPLSERRTTADFEGDIEITGSGWIHLGTESVPWECHSEHERRAVFDQFQQVAAVYERLEAEAGARAGSPETGCGRECPPALSGWEESVSTRSAVQQETAKRV